MTTAALEDVGSVGVDGESYSPVTLEIKKSGSVYSFFVNPVSERGADYLRRKSGQDFKMNELYEVGGGDCARSQDIPGLVRSVLEDIRENFGLNFSGDFVNTQIRAKEAERRREAMRTSSPPART